MKKSSRFYESSFFYFFVIIFTFFFLNGCNKTQIHLHDRHVLSYELVRSHSEKYGKCNLVLLDYHHDVLPSQKELTSVNWAGRLVEEGYVEKIIWLSGKKLRLPNRNSRFAWLERSLSNANPDIAEKIRSSIELVDFEDLQKLRLKKNTVITLDFDVFTKDPGDDAELFVNELCRWIEKQHPSLLTLSFSASYQPKPFDAWNWFCIFLEKWKNKADFFLEAGDFGEEMESYDDLNAWKKYWQHPEIFHDDKNPLYAGAYLWLFAPERFKKLALEKKLAAGNPVAGQIINIWKDSDLEKLRKTFPVEKLKSFADQSKTAAKEYFDGKVFRYQQKSEKDSFGLAVRYKNLEADRGCLSLYTGIPIDDFENAVKYCAQEALNDPRYPAVSESEFKKLFINICVFGKWQEMDSPFDFVPGIHSLIIEEDSGEKTLLQASLAAERSYSKEVFLSRLSNKAGLGKDGWKGSDLKFYKTQTLIFTDYN